MKNIAAKMILLFGLLLFGIVAISENVIPAQKLNLNFQNTPLPAALQAIANFAEINMVISNKITGNLTLHLKDVSAEQAINVILNSEQLGKLNSNGILLITPLADLKQQEIIQAQTNNLQQANLPLLSTVIPLNYAKASLLVTQLKQNRQQLLSKRGSIGYDERTNVIWLEDTNNHIQQIRQLIGLLDKPTEQVLIQARIVNLDKTKENELGVRWYLGSNNPSNTFVDHGFKLDLPATNAGGLNGAGEFGFSMAKLNSDLELDLQLSALESQGFAQIMASPQIITANQTPALIETGEEIPYQQATSEGATSVAFKKAVLSLRVVPQITPDQHILLNLTVNQDKKGADLVQGVPTIDTREIQTQVLVKNGQTIVLGGIYQTDTSNNHQQIPGLGDLPAIGHLFQHQSAEQQTRELIIFVTPVIIRN